MDYSNLNLEDKNIKVNSGTGGLGYKVFRKEEDQSMKCDGYYSCHILAESLTSLCLCSENGVKLNSDMMN